MKIGLVTHYFWPEIAAPSARLLDLGRRWAARGHEVVAVTNFPNHPTGVVPAEYRGRTYLVEERDGVRIVRCRTYATPNRGVLRRTIGHLVFMLQAARQGYAPLRGADVVVVSSPTLFSGVAALWLARRLRVPLVFEVRDLWPAIFVELGVLRQPLLIRALEVLELFLYRQSRAVVTVTQAFARDIARRGIDAAKLHVIFNGVDLELFRPGPADQGLLERLGLQGKFVVLYCGAHGISQGLGRILEAAALLRDEPSVHFLFVGEGAEKQALEQRSRKLGLGNVTFLNSVPREQVPAFYRSADVCLVPLRDAPLFASFIPSKMFEALACGRPIVASVAGEAAEILQASGAALVVPPEDVGAIAGALRRLVAQPALREAHASRGRAFIASRFDRDGLASRYLELLKGVVVSSRGGGSADAAEGPSRARASGAEEGGA